MAAAATHEELAAFVAASVVVKALEERARGELTLLSADTRVQKEAATKALTDANATCVALPDGRFARLAKAASARVPTDDDASAAMDELHLRSVESRVQEIEGKRERAAKRRRADGGGEASTSAEDDAFIDAAIDALRPRVFPTTTSFKVTASCERGAQRDADAPKALVEAVARLEHAQKAEAERRERLKRETEKERLRIEQLQAPLIHWHDAHRGVPRLQCTVGGKRCAFAVCNSPSSTMPPMSVGIARAALASLLPPEGRFVGARSKRLAAFKAAVKSHFATKVAAEREAGRVVARCVRLKECKA